MNVRALMDFLRRQNPDATVVICDSTEFIRAGLIRPLRLSELQLVQLRKYSSDDGTYLCEWGERSIDCEGPISAVLVGPR